MALNIILASGPKHEDVLREIINKGPTVVMFGKATCPFCAYLRPYFHELTKKFDGDDRITFYEVDITDHSDPFKEAYGFKKVPKVYYFKDGQKMLRHATGKKTLKTEDLLKNVKEVYGFEPLTT